MIISKLLLLTLLLATSCITKPREDLTFCKKAWNETERKNYEIAIDLYQSCINTGNLSENSLARTYRNIGITYYKNGKYEEAIIFYDKAIALKPDDIWNDYVNRGNAWDDLKNYENAMEDYDMAIKLKPSLGEAFYNKGISYEKQKKIKEAKIEFKKSYDLGSRTPHLMERIKYYNIKTDSESSKIPANIITIQSTKIKITDNIRNNCTEQDLKNYELEEMVNAARRNNLPFKRVPKKWKASKKCKKAIMIEQR